MPFSIFALINHPLSHTFSLRFRASASEIRMWFSNQDDDDDSDSSDNLFLRLVECRFCHPRPRSRDRLRSRFEHEESNYELLDDIGEGSYCRVNRCKDNTNGAIVAIKQIHFGYSEDGVPASVIREVSLLKELEHENIVRLQKVFAKETYVNLVFELLDSDLNRYIIDNSGIKDPKIIKSFMQQILTGVAYCHALKILHRDLKPKNLLIDESKMIIKIADFGLAREFGDDILLTPNHATRWYNAPEALLGSQHYSARVDLWAVGCIFGEMVTGKKVFGTVEQYDELEAIFRMLGTPTEETWPGVSEFTRLKNYAKFNPVDLRTFFAGLEPEGLRLLEMLLCLDPRKRISAEAALAHAYFKDSSVPN